ncbi:transporter substrate-binding domain-containing protein [Rhodoferax sp. AJA081-3]|uniref:transporter substrate-binding domain-containing diguanylate cyclase n=1 Tax=Rhodoferax sp. AJA081-3 TaxID=2752316 RepID=UPI001ADFD72B|nr:transporter substrate-binding domain-containing protein [Rhodoferax sp. AJA081-3]QTN29820.1 transporter substrate-binding domain-containing protein [Rhodoferax sp. AJA081-3]
MLKQHGLALGRAWWACLLLAAAMLLPTVHAAAGAGIPLTTEQTAWLDHNKAQTFTVGFDPFGGVDSFELRGKRHGFLHLLLADIHKQTGLRLVPANSSDWDDAYSRFVAGKIDILYGANPTHEREKIMRFTAPAQRYPYVVLAPKAGNVQTLSELDGKRLGVIANDFVLEALPRFYPNIHFKPLVFSDQNLALAALTQGSIDAFVTSGGGVEVEYLVGNPELAVMAQLRAITSDMTLAVLHKDAMLASILERYLDHNQDSITTMARDARKIYNRKALRLSDAELDWLDASSEAVVGVAEDYLPFDYYSNGRYLGIAGEYFRAIADTVGIRYTVVSAPFANIMDQARAGKVHVVDMAKTEDRLRDFVFPHPISQERDIVVGLKTSPPVSDIYALDGLRVAVIEGFWHEEYLRKNLRDPRIVKTQDIMESLQKVRKGEADYLIENPTVAEFYINGLGYQDLVKRGNTSSDSFVYFGVSRTQPQLASIMDKVIPLLSFEEMKYRGVQGVPTLTNESTGRLRWIAGLLSLALVAIVVVTAVTARKLTNERLTTQFLREREELLYTDTLTGLFNRNHYSHHADALSTSLGFPQAVVVADLNNLKRTNDTYGHAAGDRLIQMLAEAARAHWPAAKGYRMGGDEFLFLVPLTDAHASVQQQLEAFQTRCATLTHTLPDGTPMHPNSALGYALRLDNSNTLDHCLATADARMYAMKASQKKRRTDVG